MLSDVELVEKLLARDPYLQPYEAVLSRRIKKIREMEALLTLGRMTLQDFASGHEYFGLHFKVFYFDGVLHNVEPFCFY